jgi:hypothetical protein
MPTQLKQAISSFLTWPAYEKLAMSMTWQISHRRYSRVGIFVGYLSVSLSK